MQRGFGFSVRRSNPESALGVGLLFALLSMGIGCERLSAIVDAATGKTSKEAAKEPPPVPVVVVKAEARPVEISTEWIGTVDGSVNAMIRPRVSGYLLTQNYVEGSFVRTGDLLFTIDPRPFEAALLHAKAALTRTQAEQVKSQLDVDRLTPLVVKRAVSQQELDDAIAMNKAYLATIEADKADITEAELNLSFTRIVAPIDGIAGLANAQIGNLANPASPQPLTTISTVDPMLVYFFPTEQQYIGAMSNLGAVAAMPLDQRPEQFELRLVDGSLFPQRARFYFANRQVDQRTGSIRVAVQGANPGNLLRPGQYARVRTVTSSLPDAVVIPQRAVRDVQGSYQVGVVKPDDTIEIREVVMGPQTGTDWVVTSGLQGGETVVVEGLQKVKPGTKVAPQAAPPPKSPATPPSSTTSSTPSPAPAASPGQGGTAKPALAAPPGPPPTPPPTPPPAPPPAASPMKPTATPGTAGTTR